jgi:hypothetical protein
MDASASRLDMGLLRQTGDLYSLGKDKQCMQWQARGLSVASLPIHPSKRCAHVLGEMYFPLPRGDDDGCDAGFAGWSRPADMNVYRSLRMGPTDEA